MGLIEKLFPKSHERVPAGQYFRLITGYAPVYRSWDGQLYESELVRSAIDARSRHIMKLDVRIDGSAQPKLQTRLVKRPNDFQTWGQFLYRLNTILDMKNNAFILPAYDRLGDISGVTTVYTDHYELLDVNGTPWLRMYFDHGRHTAEELSRVGIMTKFQFKSDLFGESNTALTDTMSLIDLQTQGISEAVKNSSSYKFIAKLTNFLNSEDLKKERIRFSEDNLKAGNDGLLLFPNTYTDIQQITPQQYTVDADQMKLIQTNVFNYFGVNEKVLQNSAMGDELDAFFNGAIEPFSIQLSEVLTKMLFSPSEQAHGSRVYATANRLQYMPTAQKISMAQQLGDRGMIMIDEVRALFNYPPLPDGLGQQAPIRGEFYMVGDEKGDTNGTE
ncbi:MAG: phage portal protein [Prevotella sp.]|nr:phage portal protein [Prevotella sp.]MBR2096638.1 phage portal protein [Prevotella sp.]